MKKLVTFFIILISLALVTGCGKEQKVTRFSKDPETNKTTTTVVEPVKKEPVVKEPTKAMTKNTTEFAVTSLKDNVLKSDKGYHLIQGTTPESTQEIVVNGYSLSKYKSGESSWSYIAATSLGTLKKGENDYEVKAVDAKGDIIGSKTFTIVYDGINGGGLIATGSSLNLSILLTLMMAGGLMAYRRNANIVKS